MTLLEIMERVGSREPERVKVYVAEALEELQSLLGYKTTGQTYSVVSGQKEYSLPGTMVKLLGVYRKYDSQGRYIRIPILRNVGILDGVGSTGVSTAVSSTDIVVV